MESSMTLLDFKRELGRAQPPKVFIDSFKFEPWDYYSSYADRIGKTISVGDIVEAYSAGYHKVLAIYEEEWQGFRAGLHFGDQRPSKHTMIVYAQVATDNYKMTKAITERTAVKTCDIWYCRPVDKATFKASAEAEMEKIRTNYTTAMEAIFG
jgi:hypothetical protein